MSSRVLRIPYQLAQSLPWDDLYGLFQIKRGISELETVLQLQQGTLSKAQREYPAHKQRESVRGISAKVHQHILDRMAENFQTGAQMRAWIKKNWPVGLLELSAKYLEGLYDMLDLARQIPQVGVFPKDHIPRKKEEAEIVNMLMTNKQVQVIWITGVPGTGKQTLALSLVRCHWESLKQAYDKILWVNAEQASYADGLRQIAVALDIVETSIGVIEMKIKHLTRRKKVLIILDTLHDVDGLIEWRQLIGYLGRLVVSSRTRLTESELMGDDQIHQIRLDGFSLEQGRKFIAGFYDDQKLEENKRAVDAILEYTAGLPLALRILSGPMIELGLSAPEIQSRLERYALDALESPLGLNTPGSSLRMCFDITYEVLTERHPDAVQYFQGAGIFRTRMIHKSLMGQVLSVSDPLTEDKMAGALLRFNFLDVLKLSGERFIQLHPLLHEYAREKLGNSNSYPQLYEHYLDVIPEWTQIFSPTALTVEHIFPLTRHIQDMLAALVEFIARGEWAKAIRLLKRSFEILAIEGYTRQLEQVIRMHLEGTSESRLLRVALANLKGHLALSVLDVISAQEQFELALRTGQGSRLVPALEQVYLDEMGRAILGIARCLVYRREYRAALDLLDDLYSKDIFMFLSDHGLKVERELLLGDIHYEMVDYRKALTCLETVLEMSRGQNMNLVLERQANCYRSLGEIKRAIEIYSSLFAEQSQPTDFTAMVGLGLSDSLIENGQPHEAWQVLGEVEIILRDYAELDAFDVHFARLWKYRAFAARALNDAQRNVALECARKALDYWMKIPDSDFEEKQMQDLIKKIEGEMKLGGEVT
jgi:tetratricopeptide (TPR) repeat protein